MISTLGPLELAVLVCAAALVGLAKTTLGGVASISIVLFATVLPARESTGTLLPLLLVGDLLALRAYGRYADWPTLRRLLPSVTLGVVVGALFVAVVDDTVMRRAIAVVLLLLVAVHVGTRPAGARTVSRAPGAQRLLTSFSGSLTGFTTMVANAGGPVLGLYLVTRRFEVLAFLGTNAWFFFLANAVKAPFSVGLGLLTADSLVLCLLLSPAVVAGAAVGPRLMARLSREVLERLVLGLTVGLSLYLLW